jgi:hypothetical protein
MRLYSVETSIPAFIWYTVVVGALINMLLVWMFDIGFAGPIAGFLVLVPAPFIGIARSEVVPIGDTQMWFGEPLLIKAAAYLFWGPLPADQTLAMNAMAYAAWFGMLATALNLFPIGQLDGGHIAYAVFGRGSTYVTLVQPLQAQVDLVIAWLTEPDGPFAKGQQKTIFSRSPQATGEYLYEGSAQAPAGTKAARIGLRVRHNGGDGGQYDLEVGQVYAGR